jgi:hypothetical protein
MTTPTEEDIDSRELEIQMGMYRILLKDENLSEDEIREKAVKSIRKLREEHIQMEKEIEQEDNARWLAEGQFEGDDLYRLFELQRAEQGLSSLMHFGDSLRELISHVVDSCFTAYPENNEGRDLAIKNLLNELAEMERIEHTGHYRYMDVNYPMGKYEMRKLKRYINFLRKEITRLWPSTTTQ